jgi:hypothetical protein
MGRERHKTRIIGRDENGREKSRPDLTRFLFFFRLFLYLQDSISIFTKIGEVLSSDSVGSSF